MWMLFLGELRRRWVEVALGAGAVALVVAALVAHRAVTASAGEAIHGLAHDLGRNILVVPEGMDLAAYHGQRYGAETLPADAPAALRGSRVAQHLRMVEPVLLGNVQAPGGPVVIQGREAPWPDLGDLQPAVLGTAAARALGAAPDGVFRLGGEGFRVLDVIDAPPDGLEAGVFVPLAAAQRVLGRPGALSAIRLGGCWCKIDVAALAGEVEKVVPGARALTAAGVVAAQTGSVEVMRRYSGALHATGLLVVALVVGALVASQARRRSRELGLLVAVGAPPRALAGLFAAQAALGGAAGGVLGWAAAIPLTGWLGAEVLGAPLPAPAGLLLPAVALAAGVSALAAAVPALRATSLDPTVVLRES
jgi:hypothetical protein